MEEKAPHSINEERADELKNPHTDTAEEREELVLQRAGYLAEERENLARIVGVDGLTQLKNRGAFEDELERAVNAMHRKSDEQRKGVESLDELTVMYIDLDNFKNVNDTGGHAEGDEALVKAASCITSSIREGQDVAGRLGGDEFGVFLPRTDRSVAHAVAEKIVAKIRDNEMLSRYSVTASVGAFCADRGNSADIGAGDIMRRADEAMYRAKKEGKNTIVIDGAD